MAIDESLERRGHRQVEAAERRQHSRYAVDGWAEVLVADGSQLFRGRVLDISVAGCYIESQARLRLSPGTQVEMVFRVGGRVFRPVATCRKVRPCEGAGFLFLDLDARKLEELEMLVAELSRQQEHEPDQAGLRA